MSYRSRYSSESILSASLHVATSNLPEVFAWSATAADLTNTALRSDNTTNATIRDGGDGNPASSFSITPDTVNVKSSFASESDTYSSIKYDLTDQDIPTAVTQPFKLQIRADASDLTAYNILEMRYFIPEFEAADADKEVNAIRFELHDSANKSLSWIIGSVSTLVPVSDKLASSYLKPGWHTARFNIATATDDGITITDIIRSEFNIYIRNETPVFVKPEGTFFVTMDRVRFLKQTDTAQWFMSFDDGWESHLQVSYLLDSFGLKGTFFITGSLVDTAGYLTLDQIKDMQVRGHLIANHGWVLGNLNTNPPTESALRADINQMKSWMLANGFNRGADIWAIPGGTSNGANTDAYAQNQMYERLLTDTLNVIRYTMPDPDYPELGFTGVCSQYREPGIVYCNTYDGQTGVEIATAVDLAISEDRLGGLYGHSLGAVGGPNWTIWTDHMIDIATEVLAGNIESITLDQLVNR